MSKQPQTILITGGAGNLGLKLATVLAEQSWVRRIILGDRVPVQNVPLKGESLVCDFTKRDGGWREAAETADAIIHFAASNSSPHATWSDAVTSFDMTSMLLEAAATHECRFVFGSSNHVMGKYKELNLGPGELTTSLPPLPGTWLTVDGNRRDPQAYGASKLMGERAMLAVAAGLNSRLTGVAVRVGWCLPGENNPESILAPMGPAEAVTSDLAWSRNMWLSNRDLAGIFVAAIKSNADVWPERGIVVNGVSNNRNTPWDLEPTRRWLGYAPVDDVWALVAA